MLGLVVLFVIGIYLVISALVVWLAARWAKKGGRRGWLWGSLAALAMYNLVFWDLIPTLVMHRYYCATEAGFWVYKTPEQWVKENPGVRETLVASKGAPSIREGGMDNYTDTYFTNARFRWEVKRSGPYFVNLWRHEQTFLDVKNGEALAKYVDYSRGDPNPLELGSRRGLQGMKFWLSKEHCEGGERNQSLMRSFKNSLRGKDENE